MGAIATLLCVVGIIGVIWGVMQKSKAGRLSKAPFVKTGDASSKGDSVAGEKGALSAEGTVQCGQPLTSPVTGTPCLYYELKVVGSWKEGDQNRSKDYVDEKRAADFTVDDGSGIVKVDASKGGDFDPLEKTFDETKKEGFLADLKGAVGKGKPIMFGQYAFQNPPMSQADKFTCTEKVLKVQPKLFVLGKHEGGKITSPNWRSLILSNKGREQILSSTAKGAKNFLIGGGAALGIGVILGIISTFVSKPAVAADAPEAAEVAASGDVCAKAVACCKIISTGAEAACDALANAPEQSCQTSLDGYRKAIKSVKPDRAAECD
ncbi:MAG: hypothetical protein HYZ28_14060 [Myxococcales bacterium]|nr:hypothetical protein [Myxococcales bacterium]